MKRFRSLHPIAVAGAAALVALALQIPATSTSAFPQASFTLAKSSYLSTEGVPASLVIYNSTARQLSYSPGSVSFLIRQTDGKVVEQRWITVISRPLPITQIPPGQRRSFDVAMPVCDVVSDPCSEHVALKLLLGRPDHTWLPLILPERSYYIVADPTATYRASNLRGNLPVFIAQAQATRSILQRLLVVTFQMAPPAQTSPTAPDRAAMLVRAFRQRGLLVGGSGVSNDANGTTASVMLRDQDAGASVDAAIGDVLHDDSRVTLLSKLYQPDDFEIYSSGDSAVDGARLEAERMAAFVGAGEVTLLSGTELGGAPLLEVARRDRGPRDAFEPLGSAPFIPDRSERVASARKGLLDIRATTTSAFAGARVATGPFPELAQAGRTQYFAGAATRVAGFPWRAVIASDRPEIYAVAETTQQAADRLGLRASAVALSLAAKRALLLARNLGVDAATLTLAAAYPAYEYSPHVTVVASGVALAPTGDFDASWRGLLPQLPNRVGPFLLAMPTPTPRATLGTHEPQASYLEPIDVPDGGTKFATTGDVPNLSRADRLVLSVAISRRKPDEALALPAVSDVEFALRGNGSVEQVATQLTSADAPPGYAVTLTGNDPGALNDAVSRIRRAYGASDVVLKYDVALASIDCDALIAKAQQSSLEQALHAAVAHSQTYGRPLRHLVLALAGPVSINSENACDSSVVYPLAAATASVIAIPAEKLEVHAPVRLVFRTQ